MIRKEIKVGMSNEEKQLQANNIYEKVMDVVEPQVESIVTGSPIPVENYADIRSMATGSYVVMNDSVDSNKNGKWYYWNATTQELRLGGVWQAQLVDNTVTDNKLAEGGIKTLIKQLIRKDEFGVYINTDLIPDDTVEGVELITTNYESDTQLETPTMVSNIGNVEGEVNASSVELNVLKGLL